MVSIASPYAPDGSWLRTNLHAHSTVSDGALDPEAVIADYETKGYDVLAISDHDALADPDAYRDGTALTLLPAVEVSAGGPHLLHVGGTEALAPDEDRQAVIDDIVAAGDLAVLAHPKWQWDFDHWSPERLAETTGYHGIEIYNGLVEHHPGDELATDRWDQLLAAGRRIWGFANDDSHGEAEVGRAWNVVQVDDPSPASVIEALRMGRFYASTGVTIQEIRVAAGDVTIETEAAQRIRLVSDAGIVQQIVDGSVATFSVPDELVHLHGRDPTYVRIECVGSAGAQAWTQPMFIEE